MADSAGVRSGDVLEELIAQKSGAHWNEATGIWQAYLSGARKPFIKWAPRPVAPAVDKAERLWSGTSAWFYTPVWYLLEDREFLPSEIKACIEVLPPRFQYLLVSKSKEQSPAAFSLHSIDPELPYELAHPVTPWAVGAMACALRRSELSADLPVFRKCGVGLIWLLDRCIDGFAPENAVPIQQLRSISINWLSKIIYPLEAGPVLKITNDDLTKFGQAVEKFHRKWHVLSTEMRWPR